MSPGQAPSAWPKGAEGNVSERPPSFVGVCVWGGGLTLAVREPSLDGDGSVGLGVHPAVPHRYLRASARLDGRRARHLDDVRVRKARMLVLERLDQTHRAVQARVAAVREFLIEPDAGTGPAVAGVAIVIPAVVPERGGGGGRTESVSERASANPRNGSRPTTPVGRGSERTSSPLRGPCSPCSSSSAPSSRARLACSSRSPSSQIALSLSLSLLLSSNARSSVLPRPHPRQRLERKMELLSLCWGSCPEKKKCAHLGLPPRKRSGKGHRFAVGWERGEGPAGVCARACVCLCVCVRHARPGAGMVAAPVARSCKKMKSSYRRRNRKKKNKKDGRMAGLPPSNLPPRPGGGTLELLPSSAHFPRLLAVPMSSIAFQPTLAMPSLSAVS